MKIIGIDPGYAIVGWGIIEYKSNHFTTLDYGAITTQSSVCFDQRLLDIYNQLDQILSTYKLDAVAIEKLFFTTNQKTAIDVAQARGVISLCATQHGLDYSQYTPLQVKQSVVGYGKAEKSQVMEMTKRILNLKEIPKPDDTADALAVAICHAHTSGSLIYSHQHTKIEWRK